MTSQESTGHTCPGIQNGVLCLREVSRGHQVSHRRCDCKTVFIQPHLPASEPYQVFVHELETPPNLIWGEGHSPHPMGGKSGCCYHIPQGQGATPMEQGNDLGREINLSNAPHPIKPVQAMFFPGICLSDQSPLHLLIGLNFIPQVLFPEHFFNPLFHVLLDRWKQKDPRQDDPKGHLRNMVHRGSITFLSLLPGPVNLQTPPALHGVMRCPFSSALLG